MSQIIDLTNQDIKNTNSFADFATKVQLAFHKKKYFYIFIDGQQTVSEKGNPTFIFYVNDRSRKYSNTQLQVRIIQGNKLKLKINSYLKFAPKFQNELKQLIKDVKFNFQNNIINITLMNNSNKILIKNMACNDMISESPKLYAQMIINTFETSCKVISYIERYIDEKLYSNARNIQIALKSRNDIKMVETMRSMSMMDKENINIPLILSNQRNGKPKIKNPVDIDKKNHQILRQFRINTQRRIFTKPLSQIVKKKQYLGAFSDITYIKAQGSIINTFNQYRPSHLKQRQFIQNYDMFTGDNQVLELVHKVALNNEVSQNSLRNQISFIKLKGNSNNEYICNYYFPPLQNEKKLQLFADYHHFNASKALMNTDRFNQTTFLDIINFTQQLMLGLDNFYLKGGFIHRDIKSINILITSQGIIQIIDHGSIYPLKEKNIPAFREFMETFDGRLRSTNYVERQDFQNSAKLILKYKNYENFTLLNQRNKNFDVYAVGIILIHMFRSYMNHNKFESMDLKESVQRLISRMVKKDFELRATMQEALQMLGGIRKIFFKVQN